MEQEPKACSTCLFWALFGSGNGKGVCLASAAREATTRVQIMRQREGVWGPDSDPALAGVLVTPHDHYCRDWQSTAALVTPDEAEATGGDEYANE